MCVCEMSVYLPSPPTAPGDYAPVDRRLTFDSNTQTITVPVTINPDQIDERPERLSAILTEVSSGDNDVQLNPDQAEITIVSVGGKQNYMADYFFSFLCLLIIHE